MADNRNTTILLLHADADGRVIVVFGPDGPSTINEKLEMLEAMGFGGSRYDIQMVEAALLVPWPSTSPNVDRETPATTDNELSGDEEREQDEEEESEDEEDEWDRRESETDSQSDTAIDESDNSSVI